MEEKKTVPWVGWGAKPERQIWRTPPNSSSGKENIVSQLGQKYSVKRTTSYPYKRDPIRKKHLLRQIPGQCCDQCEAFYKAQGEHLNEAEVQELKNRVSRHRDLFERPKTPPGFWDINFTDSELDCN